MTRNSEERKRSTIIGRKADAQSDICLIYWNRLKFKRHYKGNIISLLCKKKPNIGYISMETGRQPPW